MEEKITHDGSQAEASEIMAMPQLEAPSTPLSQRLAKLAHSKAMPSLSAIALAMLTSNSLHEVLPNCFGGGHHS
jgi:hypothetical protein